MEWARLHLRLLAALIDYLLAAAASLVPVTAADAVGLLRGPDDSYVLSLCLLLAYGFLDVPLRTPGKALLKLRVVRRGQQDAERWRLSLRWALKMGVLLSPFLLGAWMPDVLIVPWILLVLGTLLPVLVGDGRALYDLFTDTVVVQAREDSDMKRAFSPVIPGRDDATPEIR